MRSREEIRAERKRFVREHDGRLRDQPSKHVTEVCDAATMRAAEIADQIIANASSDEGLRFALPRDPENRVYPQLVFLYVMSTPEFRAWLLERAEEISRAFISKLTTADFEARLGEFDEELAAIEAEGKRKDLLDQRGALDEQLAALEQD